MIYVNKIMDFSGLNDVWDDAKTQLNRIYDKDLTGNLTYHIFTAILQYACSGPKLYKLMSLIMRTSGFLQHASDWEWDILDMKASRIMALQLAPDLQAHWLTPVQLNRPQRWMSPFSLTLVLWLFARTRADSLMGHQTKLAVWLASTKVMNDKYHSPTAALLSLQLSLLERKERIMFCAVRARAWIHS